MVEIPEGVWTWPLEIGQSYELVRKGKIESSILAIEEEGFPWYYDITKVLELEAYLDDVEKRECHSIRMMAMQYILCGGQLYRRSHDGIHLQRLKKEEAERLMEEVYQGICGPHINGRILGKKVLRMRYYWNTMETDCVDFVKIWHDCQTHANLNHVLPSKLYSMTFPWPFSVWSIDVIGRIYPKALNGHKYILVAINYFTKWVEVASYYMLKAKHMARFIENNIICQFGVPQEIILDNGSHFEGEVRKIMELYKIKHHKSSPYRP